MSGKLPEHSGIIELHSPVVPSHVMLGLPYKIKFSSQVKVTTESESAGKIGSPFN